MEAAPNRKGRVLLAGVVAGTALLIASCSAEPSNPDKAPVSSSSIELKTVEQKENETALHELLNETATSTWALVQRAEKLSEDERQKLGIGLLVETDEQGRLASVFISNNKVEDTLGGVTHLQVDFGYKDSADRTGKAEDVSIYSAVSAKGHALIFDLGGDLGTGFDARFDSGKVDVSASSKQTQSAIAQTQAMSVAVTDQFDALLPA